MRVLQKVVSGAGFVFIFLGVCCVDSPSLLLPLALIAAGAVFMAVYAGVRQKWTEK